MSEAEEYQPLQEGDREYSGVYARGILGEWRKTNIM